MIKWGFLGGTFLFLSMSSWGLALTDGEIKQNPTQGSIDHYEGNCACPYHYTKNGTPCGKRSAYSRPGGYDPLCYPREVKPSMVREFRIKMKE